MTPSPILASPATSSAATLGQSWKSLRTRPESGFARAITARSGRSSSASSSPSASRLASESPMTRMWWATSTLGITGSSRTTTGAAGRRLATGATRWRCGWTAWGCWGCCQKSWNRLRCCCCCGCGWRACCASGGGPTVRSSRPAAASIVKRARKRIGLSIRAPVRGDAIIAEDGAPVSGPCAAAPAGPASASHRRSRPGGAGTGARPRGCRCRCARRRRGRRGRAP